MNLQNQLFKNIIYSVACLSFAIVIGAAVYEHLAVVPQWAMGPPASLFMYQGDYGLKPETFWMPIHPVTLILLITSLILCYKTERKKNLVITLIGYAAVLAITFVYFVPELIDITSTPYSTSIDASLTERAQQWETLSIVRLFFLIGLAINLMLGLTKKIGE